MRIIRHRAFCRAGLVGNPTDGYGGKTISFTMTDFSATAVLYPWEHLEILWSQQDKNRFSSLEELVSDVDLNGYYGGVRLVKATIKRFAEYCRTQDIALRELPFTIRYDTNIPRGVGLAGSSAIVVATLKCLMEYYGVSIPKNVQPSLARSVENDELGIACGYQDRAVQVFGGLLYMDFSDLKEHCGYPCGKYEPMNVADLPNLYVAFNESASKISDSVHGPLRTRAGEDATLLRTMEQISGLVPEARDAIRGKDPERLNEIINLNFDLRAQLYNIAPAHLEMIQTARRCGLSAKFAGSGGAIVGSFVDLRDLKAFRDAAAANRMSWRVFQPKLESGDVSGAPSG